MEFKFNQREEAFRQEVEDFLTSALPPDWAEKDISWPGGYGSGGFLGDDALEILACYRRKLIEKGWNTISWPKEYGGREYTYIEQAIFDERTSYYRAPNIDVIAGGMVAPTILRVGTEAQKKKWIPRIASGEINMWLGYSEPNAGSDLAAIQTTAVQDGDEYVRRSGAAWPTYPIMPG
jgi:alkylation response protein AidB-like acyl-CoA dehydrogenase